MKSKDQTPSSYVVLSIILVSILLTLPVFIIGTTESDDTSSRTLLSQQPEQADLTKAGGPLLEPKSIDELPQNDVTGSPLTNQEPSIGDPLADIQHIMAMNEANRQHSMVGANQIQTGSIYPMAYEGQYLNPHSGTYDYYARSYDPKTGTWLQQDPYRGTLSTPTSQHRYMYEMNSPVNYYDEYGYDIDVSYDSSNQTIYVNAEIGLYSNDLGISELADKADKWEEGIKREWGGRTYKGRKVEFNIDITSTSAQGNAVCDVFQNCIRVSDQTSCVVGENETSCIYPSAKEGEWYSDATSNIAAHEFGHLCGLGDDYITEWEWHWERIIPYRTRISTPPKEGHEWHLMANSHVGQVADHEVADLLPIEVKSQIEYEDKVGGLLLELFIKSIGK